MKDAIQDTDMEGIFESVTEVSEARAYKIRVDYATRIRVWVDDILPGRLLELRMENTLDYADRMQVLLERDAMRLTRRVVKEFTDTNALAARMKEIAEAQDQAFDDYYRERIRIVAENNRR